MVVTAALRCEGASMFGVVWSRFIRPARSDWRHRHLDVLISSQTQRNYRTNKQTAVVERETQPSRRSRYLDLRSREEVARAQVAASLLQVQVARAVWPQSHCAALSFQLALRVSRKVTTKVLLAFVSGGSSSRLQTTRYHVSLVSLSSTCRCRLASGVFIPTSLCNRVRSPDCADASFLVEVGMRPTMQGLFVGHKPFETEHLQCFAIRRLHDLVVVV